MSRPYSSVHLLRDEGDLALVEEVERRVEVFHVHDALGPGRASSLHERLPLIGRLERLGLAAAPDAAATSPSPCSSMKRYSISSKSCSQSSVSRSSPASGASGRARCTISRSARAPASRRPPERRVPQAVLVQQPGSDLRLGGLLVDRRAPPRRKSVSTTCSEQFGRRLQTGSKAARTLSTDALIDRVVGEVHLKGAQRLHERLQQLVDLAAVPVLSTCRAVAHARRPACRRRARHPCHRGRSRRAARVRTLPSRPLAARSRRRRARVSSAGMMPSSRQNSWNAVERRVVVGDGT